MKIIELKGMTKKVLTPREYLVVREVEGENIKSTRILPPVIGQKSFGKIEVVFKHPIFGAK
ncbi:MAG: hypothetical protein ACYDAI_02500 [Trichloromonadaceae bacterium]